MKIGFTSKKKKAQTSQTIQVSSVQFWSYKLYSVYLYPEENSSAFPPGACKTDFS